MRKAVIDRLTSHSGKNKKIFLITGDAGFGVLDDYKRRFPDRFLNLGVAEQNMIGFAAGLALSGFRAVIYNIIPFLLYRCYEQVRNDICYQELPVILIGIGSGITYAPQGVTHYSVEDIALARTLPNLTILSPADPAEAGLCLEYAMKSNAPVYIRIAKSGEPAIHKRALKTIERPVVITEGKEAAVLFHGSIGAEVVKALEGLKECPIALSVPLLHPLDFGFLKKKIKGVHTIITVEEHFVEGGLGSIVSEWLVRENLPFRLKKLGIKNEFIHAIKNTAGMREKYGISSDGIKKTIREVFRGG